MVRSHVGFGLGKSITVTQTEIYGFRLAKELHAGRLAGRRWAPRLLQAKFMWSGIRNWGFEDGISAIKPEITLLNPTQKGGSPTSTISQTSISFYGASAWTYKL